AWRSPTTRTSARAISSSASTSRASAVRSSARCRERNPLALRQSLLHASLEAMPHRRSAKPSGPSQRQLRGGELVPHAADRMLARGEIRDEVLLQRVITVPEVRLSADLRLANIYVLPLGGEGVAAVLAALNRNKRYIRGEVARAVNLKFAPDIRFLADETFEEADRIHRLLASEKVRRDLEEG